MRIHSSKIVYSDLTAALRRAPGTDFLFGDTPARFGSRSRSMAWDVRLESDGTPDQHGAERRHCVNVGTSRRHDRFSLPKAASYADWGHFLAHLFTVDPDALAGPYKGADDFHAQTGYAFEGSPASVTS